MGWRQMIFFRYWNRCYSTIVKTKRLVGRRQMMPFFKIFKQILQFKCWNLNIFQFLVSFFLVKLSFETKTTLECANQQFLVRPRMATSRRRRLFISSINLFEKLLSEKLLPLQVSWYPTLVIFHSLLYSYGYLFRLCFSIKAQFKKFHQ